MKKECRYLDVYKSKNGKNPENIHSEWESLTLYEIIRNQDSFRKKGFAIEEIPTCACGPEDDCVHSIGFLIKPPLKKDEE